MAGRAKTIVDAKELSIYEDLVQELEQKGYTISDNSRLNITFLAPYTPRPACNITNLIIRLETYISVNGNKIVNKKKLCEILGISKPTLDSWVKKHWLTIDDPRPSRWLWQADLGYPNNGRDYKINLDNIKKQLSKMTLLY